MREKIYILIAVLVHISGFGQNMEITWQQCFGGSMLDGAYDMVMVENGYLITGGTGSSDGDISYSYGNGDGWLVRIDSLGNILWEKTYGGTDSEAFNRIIATPDNNFYLLGTSFSSDGDISNDPYPGSPDYWIVKIDSSGNIIWDRIVGGNMGESLFTGSATADGGVLATGFTDSNDGDVTQFYGGHDTWVVKLNSNGDIDWDYTIGTDWIDKGQAILQTSDGGYLIESSSMLGEGGNISCVPHSYMTEGVLTKLDADLNIVWQRCYGGSDSDAFGGIIEINSGYLLSGYTRSNDGDVSGWHGESDVWIIKIDYFGNIIWQNALGGSNYEEASVINITDDNNIAIVGMTQSNDGDVSGNHSMSEYDYDIWIVQLNNDGELLSQQCMGGAGDERLTFGVVKKSDHNFVIAGQTDFGPSYDVACTPHGGNGIDKDFWVFEIKDCSQYPVGSIGAITGPDTTCTVYDSTNVYAISPVGGAWEYGWQLIPSGAGTIYGNGTQATVNWASGWEGTASIMARAMNDCDTTEWSQPHYTEVFTCLGIEELNAGKVKMRVYPNPAKGFVIFSSYA
ncbi:MAG: hypothetical protein GXO89_08985, partial [Chlorobi bacterium]|nr:hypothetical protein [Chlorobiota bacterium]